MQARKISVGAAAMGEPVKALVPSGFELRLGGGNGLIIDLTSSVTQGVRSKVVVNF